MKKIINQYLVNDRDILGPYSTGIVFEIDDGTMYVMNSTDAIQPYTIVLGLKEILKEKYARDNN